MVAKVSSQVIAPHQYRHLNPSLLSTNILLPRILTNIGRSPCTSSSSSSSCSSSPATTHTSTDSWGLNLQTVASKPDIPPARRKKASRACGHCQKAHLTCDDGRPCLRCTKRGLTKTCADGVRKKAKYLSDYDDALLVRPRPAIKRASEEVSPSEDCKKLKTSSIDPDGPLSVSWVGLDLCDNLRVSQHSSIEKQPLATEMVAGGAFNQVRSLGGLEDWLAGFESGESARPDPALPELMNVDANLYPTNQVNKPNQTRQRMQNWVERVDRLVEIRKLTMNVTADDEWMLKRNLDRSLMELERVISLSGTPTMIWSTSGEILKVGDEFCMLTEWSRDDLIGRHIEDLFEPESLEEYLDLVEANMFPDHSFDPASHNSKRSSLNFQHRSSSAFGSTPSLPASPSLPAALPHPSNSALDYSYTCPQTFQEPTASSALKSGDKSHKEREATQTIKVFAIRKACGQESIDCSFCFRVGQDLFDCPSTIIANFLPILTRTSYSKDS